MTETLTATEAPTLTLTFAQAREALIATVAEHGTETTYAARFEALTGKEYENQSCRYRLGGKPACIVGVVLDRLGFVVPKELEGTIASNPGMARAGAELDANARVYLRRAQAEQDNRATWGGALEEAEKWAKSEGLIPQVVTVVTLDRARSELAAIVEEFGAETTYAARFEALTGVECENQSCSYRVGGKPACIVGVLLDRLGYEGVAPEGISADWIADTDTLKYGDRVGTYLRQAQWAQDTGKTWGEAVAFAEGRLAAGFVDAKS